MAEKVKNTAKTEKVYIRRPLGDRAKAKVVGVNGKMYTVPYDTEVEVPKAVAEVLKRSERYAKLAEQAREKLINDSKA